jgi:hypothetical protein
MLGRRDLDADGVDKLFLETGAGAYTDVGVFRIKCCEVVQVTMSGSPARTRSRASVLNIGGLQASSDSLVVYSVTSTDGEACDVTLRSYDWIAAR